MKVQIDLPEIPGYEYTGEYRCPKPDEPFMHVDRVCAHPGHLDEQFPILRKLEPKPTYRPFKDYEEMKPHRERFCKAGKNGEGKPLWWFTSAESNDRYDDYALMFNGLIFEDTGEPVGIKV